jgi:hypothetical protein
MNYNVEDKELIVTQRTITITLNDQEALSIGRAIDYAHRQRDYDPHVHELRDLLEKFVNGNA